MKIKLIAIAPEDGWAFFAQEDNIYLLRPPYTTERLVQVSKDIVEKAIFHHGFESDEISFDTMAELINYVEERFVEIEKAQGKGMPSLDELREILEFATDDVLDMFLTRTENELIPQRVFGPARAIATDLLRLDSVINNPRMRERALDILVKCNQEVDHHQALTDEISKEREQSWQRKFPNAAKGYPIAAIATLCNTVRQRGQLMPMAI